ncbi:MAG: N-acetylmuramoyl-L-alanine amidase [Deltaproteobacteria bacterium]|nr:MAG: N-acetylmuramoyl-L-alanine amidase [Deltaproteobacteria bacterium]
MTHRNEHPKPLVVLVFLVLMVSVVVLGTSPLLCRAAAKVLTVIVDPGHGGRDLGGRGPDGAVEKDITLALARKLVEKLREDRTVRPVLTRRDDYTISLDDRAGLANNRGGDLLISLHLGNSFRPVPLGISVYYWSPATAAPTGSNAFIHGTPWDQEQHSYWERSRLLAELVQQDLLRTVRWQTGGVLQANLYLLRRVQMPAIVVELGSLSHVRESAELQKPVFQEAVARALREAIERYWEMQEEKMLGPDSETQ